MKLRTYAWTTGAPNDVEHAEFDKPDGEVRAYVAALETAARDQGFSFAVYGAGVLPWASLRSYAADTGHAGPPCDVPGCTTPVGVMP
jgi:hypothetical protein